MSSWANLSFSDASSSESEQSIYFHDHTMMILSLVTVLVFYMLNSAVLNSYSNLGLLEGQESEAFWTFLPGIILIFIAFPSLQLLYLMEEVKVGSLILKVTGSQWYWSYTYHDYSDLSFKSQILLLEEESSFLKVDNRVVVPLNYPVQFSVTASDVIHSWTVPSLGVKVDAVPGRTNCLVSMVSRGGLFLGQCSEICGAQHSFMPIVLEVLPMENFGEWMKKMSN